MKTFFLEKALLIDDDSVLITLLAAQLRAHGIHVTAVSNGAEGWQRLMDSEYDVIISDIQMPEMDGMQLYAKITQIKPQLARKFVFMTGAGNDENVKTFLRESGNYYVLKPFTNDVLIDVLWQAWHRCVTEEHSRESS